MGKAIWDYYHKNTPEDIQTETSISELDILPIEYLFRNFEEMNSLEQKALMLTAGKTLDVGAAAGCHSLYLQNIRKIDVTALDISSKAIEICREQGVESTYCGNILDYNKGSYDTILLLMNGTGVFESLKKIDHYLKKLSSLLNDNGQILLDSTDILYMFDRDTDGGIVVPAGQYYGELDYFIHYKGESEAPMQWLYLDFNTLKNAANANGLVAEKILQEDDSYLARLTKAKS